MTSRTDATGSSRRTALVTGCSRGIGRATALALHREGLRVFATARDESSLAELAHLGIGTMRLDTTDEMSMTSAVQRIESECGAVDVLVNNAGHGLSGVIEDVPAEEVRRQFDTNVFGPARLIQLVLPGMRARRRGTIVTVSSVFGRYATPGGGYYHASKHAIEAISESLRGEVRPFGIHVVVVAPGPVRTAFADRYVGGMRTAGRGPYAEFLAEAAEFYDAVYTGRRPTLAGRFTNTAEDVSAAIVAAVGAASPRPRYVLGLVAHTTLAMRRVLPDRLFDVAVRRMFPVPRTGVHQRVLQSLVRGDHR